MITFHIKHLVLAIGILAVVGLLSLKKEKIYTTHAEVTLIRDEPIEKK